MLGFEAAQSAVLKYTPQGSGPGSQGWKTFLRNQAQAIAAVDLCVVLSERFDRLFSPGLPWHKGYSYGAYHNEVHPQLVLGKDVPLRRPVQRSSVIAAVPILSGLHHHYVRIRFRNGQGALPRIVT